MGKEVATIPEYAIFCNNSNDLKTKIDAVAKSCANFIPNRDNLPEAKKYAKAADALKNEIEKERKRVKMPYKEIVDQIDAAGKSLISELEKATKEMRERILVIEREIEAERQLALKKLEEEKAKILASQTMTFDEKMDAAIDMEGAAREVVDAKSKNVQKVMKYEIEDLELIPRRFLVPDDKAIKNAITKLGIREIPGLKIYEDVSLNLRKV